MVETPPVEPEKLTHNYAPNAPTEEEASVIIDLAPIREAFEEEVVMVRTGTGKYEVIPKSEADELARKWDEKTPQSGPVRVLKEDLLKD